MYEVGSLKRSWAAGWEVRTNDWHYMKKRLSNRLAAFLVGLFTFGSKR